MCKVKKSYVIAILGLAILSLFIGIKRAEAKTITYLNSASETPETTAYFKQFSSEDYVALRKSDRIGMYDAHNNDDTFWEHGLVFYLNENEYGYFSVSDAVSVDMRNIGFTVDGKQLDGTLTFSVEGSGSTHTVDGYRAVFLVLNCKNPSVSWECTSISMTQDWKSSGVECACTTVYTKMYLYEHDSGQPYYGRLAFYVADLDVSTSRLPEQVRILNGFDEDVYVSKDTQLDRNELIASSGTHFVSTREYEPTSFLNGFVAYINNPWSDWTWSGDGCGTEFGSITETYPSSVVGDLTKTIEAIDGVAPQEAVPKAKRGNLVDYSFEQNYPYVVQSNAPASITLSDTFDERFDLSRLTWRVEKASATNDKCGNTDETHNWNMWRSGQTVFFSAKNTASIGGTYRFVVCGLLLQAHCLLGELVNSAHSEIIPNNTVQSKISKDSNQVKLEVLARYDELTITKTIKARAFVKAHGIPTFFFCLEGTRHGSFETKTVVLSFDDIPEGEGEVSKSTTISLEGFDGETCLYEMDSLRYRLISLSTPGKDAKVNDNKIIFDLAGAQDSYRLSACFINEKVFQEKTSDTNLVINEVLS